VPPKLHEALLDSTPSPTVSLGVPREVVRVDMYVISLFDSISAR
jgi:hypothetical protein